MKSMKKLYVAIMFVLGGCAVSMPACHAFDMSDAQICLATNAAFGFAANMLPKGCAVDETSTFILFLGLNLGLQSPNLVSIPAYVLGKVGAAVTKYALYGETKERRELQPMYCTGIIQ